MPLLNANNTGLQLRCALEETKAIDVLDPTTTIVAGEMDLVDGLPVVYATSPDKSLSDRIAGIFNAPKIQLPCAAATTGDYAVGTKVYYDSSAKEVTGVASGNTLCGVVLEAAEVGDELLLVMFNGELGL